MSPQTPLRTVPGSPTTAASSLRVARRRISTQPQAAPEAQETGRAARIRHLADVRPAAAPYVPQRTGIREREGHRKMRTRAQVVALAVGEKRERKRFIALERDLVGGDPLFVAEIDADLQKRLGGRSAFWQETEHTLLVASNGRDVARCA